MTQGFKFESSNTLLIFLLTLSLIMAVHSGWVRAQAFLAEANTDPDIINIMSPNTVDLIEPIETWNAQYDGPGNVAFRSKATGRKALLRAVGIMRQCDLGLYGDQVSTSVDAFDVSGY